MKRAAKRMSSPTERPTFRWGLESWLDCWAWIILTLGLLLTLIDVSNIIWMAFHEVRSQVRIIAAVTAMFHGMVGVVLAMALFLLFRWAGETLRLLKKQSCLDYSGQISASPRLPMSLWVCSACQNPTYNEKACEHCGASFE